MWRGEGKGGEAKRGEGEGKRKMQKRVRKRWERKMEIVREGRGKEEREK